MRRLTLKELQETELDILIAFDRMCREEGIHYSLGGGTLIGAVRHKGFIPWDDDIDVFMKREEYEKFKKKIYRNRSDLNDRYHVLLPGAEGYPYPFIKIIDTDTILYEKNTVRNELGVWIDIFPIDFCAQHKRSALKIAKYQLKLFRCYARGRYRCDNQNINNMIKNFFWLPFFRIQTDKVKNKMLEREKKFSENTRMRYAGPLVWASSLHDVYPSEYFDGYTQIEFEKHRFMIFRRYDDILKHRYGNYMELPPESERVSHEPEAYMKQEK
ncbi:MAG: LicD family protein [Lachnospiraceae bacterium]|nr:LicD family protein [Lachnospiraceae bacterium]